MRREGRFAGRTHLRDRREGMTDLRTRISWVSWWYILGVSLLRPRVYVHCLRVRLNIDKQGWKTSVRPITPRDAFCLAPSPSCRITGAGEGRVRSALRAKDRLREGPVPRESRVIAASRALVPDRRDSPPSPYRCRYRGTEKETRHPPPNLFIDRPRSSDRSAGLGWAI